MHHPLANTFKPHSTVRRNRSLAVFILLAVTAWIAHFFYFRNFGLYEDDYAFIADAMERSGFYLFKRLQYFVSFPQGRPIGFFCAALLSFAGDKLGGLQTNYLLGFAIVTLNSYLFYCILQRTHLEELALLGALAFCLFPADTTKILLTHAFILQVSLTCLLIATLCYLSNHRIIAYLVVLGSLLSYESAFMVFFGIPLLKQKWNQTLVKELVRHGAVLIGFLLCIAAIRLGIGEERASDTSSQAALIPLKILGAMMIGPNVSLSRFIAAPLETIKVWDTSTALASVLSFIVFTIALLNVKRYSNQRNVSFFPRFFEHLPLRAIGNEKISVYRLKLLRLLITGVILLCLGYSLAFTFPHYPPAEEAGRLTSVHLAATFGGAIVFASLVLLIVSIVARSWRKYAILLLPIYLSTLVGYHFTIQQDFKRSWEYQRDFWTGVVASTPDVDERTTVLVVNENLPGTKFILTHSWADPLILKQLYQFPNEQARSLIESPDRWIKPPTLFLVPPDWQEQTNTDGQRLSIPLANWQGFGINVLPETTIIMQLQGDSFVRLGQPILIKGQSFTFKSKSTIQQPSLAPGVLYNYLIRADRSSQNL